MLEKFKNISLVDKILYTLAIVLLLVWVVPTVLNYYSTQEEYTKAQDEIKKVAMKYSIEKEAEPFSVDSFNEKAKRLFSRVTVTPLDKQRYSVTIKMKKEDIDKFHTFIETLALQYLVQIDSELTFEANDNFVEAKMVLATF